MNGLDLFSGIGGISLALRDWVKPVAYCEIDPYCQAVLLSRMYDGSLQNSPIWDDITTLSSQKLMAFPSIDIIYGGFPCQDISCAGSGAGLEGKRSGLFFEILRLAKEIKPSFIFLENVPAITSRGGLRVVSEIAALGYDCRWCVISASSVGALHRRERWFMLAYSKHNGTLAGSDRCSAGEITKTREQHEQAQMFGEAKRTSIISTNVAYSTSESSNRYTSGEKEAHTLLAQCGNDGYTNSEPSEQIDTCTKPHETERDSRRRPTRLYWPLESREHWQETVSSMDKCSDGIPYHTHRLRALGNAVVPEQAKEAFEILMGIKEDK